MKTVTFEQFMEFDPCYSAEKVRRFTKAYGDKTEWTAVDVLKMEDVPAVDRLWAVLREEFINARILHEFACWCAEQALTLVKKPDPRSLEAIHVKRLWIDGKATDKELDAARYAARDAARDASWYAVWYAVWGDARYAAWDAARYAAWYVTRYATRDTTRNAARDAIREEQIAHLLKILVNYKEED